MLNRKLSVIISFLLLSKLTMAGYPEKCPDVGTLAKGLLEIEFHGRRSSEYQQCLKKLKNDSLWVRPEQNDEALNKAPKVDYWLSSIDSLKVTKVEPTKINERYKVLFSYKVDKSVIEDSFILETYEGTMKKMVGCAAIVTAPKNMTLLKSCKKN